MTKSNTPLPRVVVDLLDRFADLALRLTQAREQLDGEPFVAAFVDGGRSETEANRATTLADNARTLARAGVGADEIRATLAPLEDLSHVLLALPLAKARTGPSGEDFRPNSIAITAGESLLLFDAELIASAPADWSVN
tara:strand:- start:285 stop:698 length:414 start_codon:yes stop_codon:yes gene_type:complete